MCRVDRRTTDREETDPEAEGSGRPITRRTVLAASVTWALALAGCSDGDDGGVGDQSGDPQADDGAGSDGDDGSGLFGANGASVPGGGGGRDWPTFRGDPGQAAYSSAGGPGPTATRDWEWSPPAPNGLVSPWERQQVVVADGTAYVPANVSGLPDTTSRVRLYALDAGTGAREWFHERDWGETGVSAKHSMPTVVDGQVVMLVTAERGSRAAYLGIEDGDAVWTVSGDDLVRPSVSAAPVGLSDGDVLAGVQGSNYSRLDPDREAFVGERLLFEAVPTVSDGNVYAVRSFGLIGGPIGGDPEWTVRWRSRGVDGVTTSPVVHAGETLYVGAGRPVHADDGGPVPDDRTPRLFALDPATGETDWTAVIEPSLGDRTDGQREVLGLVTSLAVAPNAVYAYTSLGDVRAYSPADGTERLRVSVGEPGEYARSSGLVAGPEGAYVALPDGLVHVSTAGEATRLADADFGSVALSLAGGRLYAAFTDRVVTYA